MNTLNGVIGLDSSNQGKGFPKCLHKMLNVMLYAGETMLGTHRT